MKLNMDKLRAKMAKLNGERSDEYSKVQLWKPGVGEYSIRVLPWPEALGLTGDGEPFCERFFYYNIARYGILAPSQFGKEDPVDELRRKLFSTKDEDDKQVAKKLFPKQRNYAPIVVLEGEGANPETPIVWAFGTNVYKKFIQWFMKEKIGYWTDLEKGFNVTVTITQQKGKSFKDIEVELNLLDGRCALNDDPNVVEEIVNKIPDLNKDYFEEKSTAEIEKLIDEWLRPAKNDNSEGTEKSTPKKDALDDLVNDVASSDDSDEEKKASKPAKKATAKKSPPKKKVDDLVEEDDNDSNSDLDDAFNDLMEDE